MESIHDQVTARNETAFISLVFAVFACAVPLIDDPRLNISDRLDDGGMGMVYYERYDMIPLDAIPTNLPLSNPEP